MDIDLRERVITLPKPPRRPKKITGTRFAPILGLSPWQSPFEAWCDVTGTYQEPFEDTIYTAAGKIIEPKVIAWLDRRYYFGRGRLKGAEEWLGRTKRELRYDHFPREKLFGGMWDARTEGSVWEVKTTKRVEDWMGGDGALRPPEYYKLQGALYAWLLGLDDFRLTLTVLREGDYAHPEDFLPSADNTMVFRFSLASEYPHFADMLQYCRDWYARHVTAAAGSAVSPPWDEGRKGDRDIVAALRVNHIAPAAGSDRIAQLLGAIEPMQRELDERQARAAEGEKALKALKEQLKAELEARMGTTDNRIMVTGRAYVAEVRRAAASGVDIEALKADGLYEKYRRTGTTSKITLRRIPNEAQPVRREIPADSRGGADRPHRGD